MGKLPEQDGELFRQALHGVTPLPPDQRVVLAPPPRKLVRRTPAPAQEIQDCLADPAGDAPAPEEYLASGLNRMTLRKLRRGHWPVQDSLDLHGLNRDEARRLLTAFLQQAGQRGLRCVTVIHGQGWHSAAREGLLKRHARHWLSQHGAVLAFCAAPPHAGGEGAVWVLLRAGNTQQDT